MTNRLTPEALDALLADHQPCECSGVARCHPCEKSGWPCTVYLLASEVRDSRPVIDAARYSVQQYYDPGLSAALAHYEEGTK